MTADLADPVEVASLLDTAAEALLESECRRGSCMHLPRRGRLVVTGDLHDNPLHFERIRNYAHLDRPDHHLVLHELIHGDRLVNGVDLSYRILARVAALVLQYPGQVHPVLANHELAQAMRQSVSKGAGDNVELFDAGLEWAFGDDAALVAESVDRFVRSMPLALRCEHGTLVSHSLPGPHGMQRFDPGVLERSLGPDDYLANRGSAWLMVWGRGQKPEDIERLAERWGVKLFFCGHAHAATGLESPHPKLLILNSDHEHAMVLTVDLAKEPPSVEQCFEQAMPVASLGGV
ncbi:MAG: metallophosphoesterase [Phycisphaeraceae bacterium]|nr:metallophosphoesterase [Phycisphaeraceae bacterium]